MKPKLILCLALVWSGNSNTAIVYPKAPEGGRQIAYEKVSRVIQAFPGAFSRTATSSSVLTETFRFDGKIKQAVTKESATFGMIEGKVLLTAMNSEVTIK
jgi:hypothetical protein